MQMFGYGIKGFLHWGYNYYYNCESDSPINPFLELSGECWAPAGDPFIVYPGREGKPIGSIRHEVFYHALEDVRAMELCSRMYSKEAVISAIEDELGYKLDMCSSARTADVIIRVRERINAMIGAALA